MKRKKKKIQLIPSMQVPLFKQESKVQSLMLLLHVAPLKPVPGQSQLNELTPSVQLPLF